MYTIFEGRNANRLYHEVLRSVKDNGQRVAPRGKPTLEIQAITTIKVPQERVLTVPGRGNNPFFNVAENLAILHGLENQRDFLLQFNKNLAQFFDNETDKAMWAFYGTRLRKWPVSMAQMLGEEGVLQGKYLMRSDDQLQEITHKLSQDGDSRQAVATLWHPALDNQPGHKDYPCNWGVMFKIRDGKLNMTVTNRSNDIHWGLFGVNFSQFSFIQEVLAYILGVEVGEQTHMSDSLHLYTHEETHVEITNRIVHYRAFDIYDFTNFRPLFESTFSKTKGWKEVDVALETFFNCWERSDRSHGEETAMYPFQFLFDAQAVLQAYVSRKDDMRALEILDKVYDHALWAACVEYLTRLKKFEPQTEDRRFGLLMKSVEDRFGMQHVDFVMNYIYHYFWATHMEPKDDPVKERITVA